MTDIMSMSDIARHLQDTVEGQRVSNAETQGWRRWGPYVSDRQWGTVREDYSEDGDAWAYFPHDHARSRVYRWGEDALAGFSDDQQFWCLGLALWNGKDPILKERLFGLTNAEGNHGEDVKELYFHMDATPSHSYLRMLYKYPQAAFPYDELVAENGKRDRLQPEYEILDTGIFEDGRYFDITVEYAKADADDILLRITIVNRAAQPAALHVLPQLWARNIWSWGDGISKPELQLRSKNLVAALHPSMPPLELEIDQTAPWLFCENETNVNRHYGMQAPGPFKDGINDFVVGGDAQAIRRDAGTKCAAHVQLNIPPQGEMMIRLRLRPPHGATPAFTDFDAVVAQRQLEADAFYAALQFKITAPDVRLVQRRALAGLIWSKQFYNFDVRRWLQGDPGQPKPPAARFKGRNADWQHLSNADVISMPDKWEYPWYASWDLGFQAVTFAMIDPAFAKAQLLLLLADRYMHPNGQIPAYEWEFGDANPPLQCWAAWRIFEIDQRLTGSPDYSFLRKTFNKLLLNFGWWVNRKDANGLNIFQGGFLGLDNIEIFDRSAPLPTGGSIDQVDGTAWMASFALFMLKIALELAKIEPDYQDIAIKFFEHFLLIAQAMTMAGGGEGLWNEEDSFFYDLLRLPSGQTIQLRARSIVGLSPMIAVQVLEPGTLQALPKFAARMNWFLQHRPDLAKLISNWNIPGQGELRLLSLLRGHRMKGLLSRLLDEAEFLSDYGPRAVSKFHQDHPYVFDLLSQHAELRYLPAESDTGAFGGNSNWRGPVWMPLNFRLIEAILVFQLYYGDDFVVEFPVKSGKMITLREVAAMLAQRLINLSLKDANGNRPVMATYPQLAADIDSQDLVLFHEYYHGDNGRGVGASHQTGWSAAVATLIQMQGRLL
jgi:hypothetical protein